MRAHHHRAGLFLLALLGAIVAGLVVQEPAQADLRAGSTVVEVPSGAVAFVSTTTVDSAAQRCLAEAGYSVQLVDVGDPGYAAEFDGALASGLEVALWQHIDPAALTTASLAEVVAQRLVSAAQAANYPAGGTLFLDLHGVPSDAAAQQIIDSVNQWSTAVAAAGYLPGLRVGPEPGLSPSQLAATDFDTYWQSEGGVPALLVGYSVGPRGQTGVAVCGTTVADFVIEPNTNGKTLTAVRRDLETLPPPSTSGDTSSTPPDTSTSLSGTGEPTASTTTELVSVSSATISQTPIPTAEAQPPSSVVVVTPIDAAPTKRAAAEPVAASAAPPTLPNTGVTATAVTGAAVILLSVGFALTWSTRRRSRPDRG